jgi:DNA-binding beta-propeller fold protein YncE
MTRFIKFMHSHRAIPVVLAFTTAMLITGACASSNSNNTETSSSQINATSTDIEEPGNSDRSYAGTTPAPEFPTGLDWLNTEQPLTLEQLEGKIVLLDFWTYGCINCMHIIPDLKRLEAEYPDELVVIGVHSAKFENEADTENIRNVIVRYDLEHPVVNDKDFLVWRTWGARAWPTLALVDPAGNVVGGHSGEGIYDVFKPVIASLVEEFEDSIDRTPVALKLEKEGLPSRVLSFPGKVLADSDGERLFIADTNHNRILITDPKSGAILDVIGAGEAGLVDGGFAEAQLNQPQGMALSEDGTTLYVADTENHAVRIIDLTGRTIDTLVGTGAQARAYPPPAGPIPDLALNSPWDLALDGEDLYVAMAGSHQISVIDMSEGRVKPYAGGGGEGTRDGSAFVAELAQPSGLALDPSGRLYFADSEASSIRWVDAEGVHTLVGSGESLFEFGDVDGVGQEARLQHPLGTAFLDGSLYVADTYNDKIKVVDPETMEISTLAGSDGGWRDGDEALFYEPGGLDAADGVLYIADTNNHAIRVLNLQSGETSTLVLSGIEKFATESNIDSLFGEVLTLEPIMVQSGTGTIELHIDLPEGFKLNDDAPSSVAWTSDGGNISVLDGEVSSLTGVTFPVDFATEFTAGEGTLIASMSLYYCEDEKESLCFFEPVRIEAPFTAGDGGGTVLPLSYALAPPEGFGD